jgi:predicted RNase H-like nuclease (RuvC/YqgF family)
MLARLLGLQEKEKDVMSVSDEYDKIFSKLPEPIQQLSRRLAVKEFAAAMIGRRLNSEVEAINKLRSELAEKLEEIEILKVEMRDAITSNAKEMM